MRAQSIFEVVGNLSQQIVDIAQRFFINPLSRFIKKYWPLYGFFVIPATIIAFVLFGLFMSPLMIIPFVTYFLIGFLTLGIPSLIINAACFFFAVSCPIVWIGTGGSGVFLISGFVLSFALPVIAAIVPFFIEITNFFKSLLVTVAPEPQNSVPNVAEEFVDIELTYKQLRVFYTAHRVILKGKEFLPDTEKLWRADKTLTKRAVLSRSLLLESEDEQATLRVVKSKDNYIKGALTLIERLGMDNHELLRSELHVHRQSYNSKA